ncbi:MAG TPA: hypothetical protein VMS74_09170 [Acidimicrobiia bacterium]|nr:hypothetical protein [Acidimicrobiia bacterium]
MRRDLALGIGTAVAVVWLTFYATAGAVMVATLIAAIVVLIWFSTVDTERLRDRAGRPHLMLFSLTALAGALVVTAAVFIATPTVFLVGCVVFAASVVGLVRALRASMGSI